MSSEEHKRHARHTYGLCWEYLGRTLHDYEKRDLVGFALTSRYHWQQAGGARELAIADWMASRAFAVAGLPSTAIDFALTALNHGYEEFPAWLKASLNEGVARAYASASDRPRRDEYVALALAELDKETDAEDAEIIRGQIAELLDD